MSEIFHLTIKQADHASFSVSAAFGDDKGSADVMFTPSNEYKLAKKRLLERLPGLGLISLEDQRPVCMQIGSELFNTFFADSVLRVFKRYRRANSPPRVALHLERQLYREPWELLRDPDDNQRGDFLSLVGSVVRFDGESGSDPTTTLIPPARSLRCLFVSPRATPTQEEGAVPEFNLENHENIQFDVVEPATYNKFLLVAVNDTTRPDGFIFYGHGRVKDKVGNLVFVVRQGYLPFISTPVGDPRQGSAVSTALAEKTNLRFSILMACETAWMSDDEDPKMRFEDTVAGSLMTRTKVGFVLGAQLKIDFLAAQTFFAATLSAVQSGTPLDLAMRVGRISVSAMSPEVNARSPQDWWVPVLYARSAVFDIIAKPSLAMPELTGSF